MRLQQSNTPEFLAQNKARDVTVLAGGWQDDQTSGKFDDRQRSGSNL
jgi:hypothetical protein